MIKFIKYVHYGVSVWVNEALKGKHRAHCLCYSCEKFKPELIDNCPIAQGNYEYCVKHDLVVPVWECPKFKEKMI